MARPAVLYNRVGSSAVAYLAWEVLWSTLRPKLLPLGPSRQTVRLPSKCSTIMLRRVVLGPVRGRFIINIHKIIYEMKFFMFEDFFADIY